MFSKLFGLVSGFKKAKSVLDTLLAIADRADDDRDHNGKADALDLKDRLVALEEKALAQGKALALSLYSELQVILEDGKKLVTYIKDGE